MAVNDTREQGIQILNQLLVYRPEQWRYVDDPDGEHYVVASKTTGKLLRLTKSHEKNGGCWLYSDGEEIYRDPLDARTLGSLEHMHQFLTHSNHHVRLRTIEKAKLDARKMQEEHARKVANFNRTRGLTGRL